MPKSSKQKRRTALVFEKQNYMLLLTGFLLIVVGFVAMYLEGEFLGFVSLTLSPLLVLAGYGVVGYGLLWWPNQETEPSDS
ncbi:MAG: DUF3098 domain-containing protein [Salinibacter sp.]